MKQKRVYTYGVYDLLHVGHIRSLKQAKKQGDYLIVGIFTDEVVESFKRRPVIDQALRHQTIEELGIADMVVYQQELEPNKNIENYNVDIVAKGPGAGFENMKFRCKKVLLNYCDLISTSQIIKKIKNNKNDYNLE
jgi:cytidyltransferase-like protein